MKKLLLVMEKRLVLLVLSFLLINCNEDDSAPIIPEKAILGRWEVIENSFGEVKPDGYEEFLSDSIHISYIASTDEIFESTYWFEDSMLVISTVYGIVGEDTTVTFTLHYDYQFLTPNKFKKTLLFPSLNPISVYQRIN